jgi:hypothetical protein
MPYAVPDNIRTSRNLPRILACIVVLLWLLTLAFGLKALKEQQIADKFLLDDLFTEGRFYWGAQLRQSSGKCAAFLESDFKPHPSPTPKEFQTDTDSPITLGLSGAFRFLIFKRPSIAELHIHLGFSALRKLEYLRGKVVTNIGELLFKTDEGAKNLEFTLPQNEPLNRPIALPFPNPIYLSQERDNSFRLNIPQDFPLAPELFSSPAEQTSLSLFKLDEETFADCRAQVLQGQGVTNSTLIDIGRYLLPFGITKKSPVVVNLSEPESDYDKAD